jgi:hypothetical protein
MTHKAKELAIQLYEETKKQFPEIVFSYIQPHPEQARRFWIKVHASMNEDRRAQMREFVADRATDILIADGYSFAVMVEQS